MGDGNIPAFVPAFCSHLVLTTAPPYPAAMPPPLRHRNRYMLDIIGAIVTRDHELVATCRPCGRSATLDLVALIERRGEDWPRARVKARCRQCGGQAEVKMRPIRPAGERPPGRDIPFVFVASVEHMIDGDRVHYTCQTCGDHWTLGKSDILAHPMARDHKLRDTFITRCGNCGEAGKIAARTEWVEAPAAQKYDP